MHRQSSSRGLTNGSLIVHVGRGVGKGERPLPARTLAESSTKIAFVVDEGTSSAMAIGSGAKGMHHGTVAGDLRLVAMVFGLLA